MSDIKKGFVIIGISILLAFICGFTFGGMIHERSAQKEIILLSIELTKLEIKKLKAVK